MNFDNFIHRYGLWIALFLGGLAVAIVLPTFFQLDDFALLCALRFDYPKPHHWLMVWPSGFWRPFQLGTLWLESRLFGSLAEGYRFMHGMYYLCFIALFYKVVEMFTASRRTAFLGAGLFACSYSHWEAIQWICASSELWIGLFAAAFLYALLRYQDTQRAIWFWMAFTAHLLALLTKESSVALLPIAGLVLWYRNGLSFFKKPLQSVLLILPWLALLVWRISLVLKGSIVQQGQYSLSVNDILHNLGAYFLRKPFPWLYQPSLKLAVLALAFLTVLLLYLIYKKQWLGLVGLLWMLLGFMPYAGFHLGVHPSRYTFLGGMGFFLALAVGWDWLLSRSDRLYQTGMIVFALFCVLNLSLYALHPEIRQWTAQDAKFRSYVEDMRAMNLPPGAPVAILNPDDPKVFADPAASFRALYSFACPPPPVNQFYANPGSWPHEPAVILEIRDGEVIRVK